MLRGSFGNFCSNLTFIQYIFFSNFGVLIQFLASRPFHGINVVQCLEAHFSWTWSLVLFGNFNCFRASNGVFWQKNSTIWFKKWVNKVKNHYHNSLMATFVALAVARRVKTALMLDNIFWQFDPFMAWNLIFSLFYCYNKTISNLFC